MKLFTWNEELEMAKKGFTPEKIVALLRQVEVLIGQGKSTPVACREAGISPAIVSDGGRPQGIRWAAARPGQAHEGP